MKGRGGEWGERDRNRETERGRERGGEETEGRERRGRETELKLENCNTQG